MNEALFTPAMENKVKNIESDIKTIKAQIANLQKLFGSCVTTSDLNLSESTVRQLINQNTTSIADMQQKLSKITLPDDTRYYLKESEVESFRANSQKMIAMMSELERMYDAIVAYTTNLK